MKGTDFAEVRRRFRLAKYLSGELGTLYLTPCLPEVGYLLVRQLDSKVVPELLPAYVGLVRDAQQWIERYPSVAALARIQQPIEVGCDYLIWPKYPYTPTSNYYDLDDPAPPPQEWALLFAALGDAPPPATPHDALVASVVRRTFMEPNVKVYFHGDEGRFVAVDLYLTHSDVSARAQLDAAPF
jgi:hypothetical protein